MAALDHFFYWSIIFTGLISLRAYGERCLSCNEVIEPRHCNVALECAQNEICFTQKYIDISGEEMYNVGCMENKTCARLNGNAIHVHAYFEHQQGRILRISCQQCCTGKACNLNGCGAKAYPGDKGLLCFQCKQHRDAGNCLTFQECYGPSARCYVETFEEYGDRFYQHGCSFHKDCSLTLQTEGNPLNVFGKKRHVRSTRLLNRTCCDSDFCNDGTDTTSKTTTEQNVVNHFGKEFFLSFPSTSQNIDKIEVMLSGLSDATVTFESRMIGVNRTVLVPATTGLSVFLPANVLYVYNRTKTSITYKTVRLVSDIDISVFVMIYEKDLMSDGYLAIPTKTLGRKYSFIFDAGLIAITATTDKTNLNVRLIVPSTNKSSSTNYTYTLSKLQTLFMQEEGNTIGFVEASADIYVVEAFETSLLESALPLQSPTTYVVVSLGDTFNTIACLIEPNEYENYDLYFSRDPSENNTILYFFHLSRASEKNNNSVIASTTGEMSCVSALQKGLVSLQSVASFSSNYLFKTPNLSNYTHYATLLTPKQYQDGIFDNRKPLIINEHYEVHFDNTQYVALMLNITEGLHYIDHANRHAKFGLTLYGYDCSNTFAYAYPAGFERIK